MFAFNIGITNGIGEEISGTFMREGAHVVLADLAAEEAQTVADEITAEPGIKAIALRAF